jgi:NTE family protein
VDVTSVVRGAASPFSTVADEVRDAYDDQLFHGATLQDLPGRPVFIFNATNLASGALVRFTKRYVADWRVGRVSRPQLPLAVAVACSSAFPPFLSPYHLDLSKAPWTTDRGNDLTGKKFRSVLPLSDGGVYDNLGIEPVWKQSHGIVVSDAGGELDPDSDPPSDWPRQLLRVLHVVDHQVRSLRKRQVIQSLATHQRDGVYLGIRSQVTHYRLADPMPADPTVTDRLARISTRLDKLAKADQERLVNWGYVMCDTGMRRHVDRRLAKGSLPYPGSPLSH